MFAVLKTGGKQYKVQSGDIIRVERLAAEAGETVQFNEILLLGGDAPVVGDPLIKDAAVQAKVIDEVKSKKVVNFVKRRRKHGSQRTKGHRQKLTLVRVTEILNNGSEKSGVKAAIGAGSMLNTSRMMEVAPPAVKKAEPKAKAKAELKVKVNQAPASKIPAPAAGGNLKKLSGVGPALEKKLQAAGVNSLEQVAAWTDADTAKFDAELSLKGRIERDGWVAQAQELTSK